MWSTGQVFGPAARSLAIALANYGDKGPLLDFLDRGLATDRTHELNLRYYAAWLGDTGALISWGELWKTGSTSEWSEYTVLAGLRTSLRASSPILELTARSVRLLLERNPGLAPTAEGQAAARRAHSLLDDGTVSDVARRDLTQIARSREDAPA